MTSRERLLCAIRGGVPDRVPVAPFGLGRLDTESDIAKELVHLTDPFIPVGIGDPFLGAAARTRAAVKDAVTTTWLETPRGPLRQCTKRDGVTTWKIEAFCKTIADIEAFLSAPYEPPTPNATRFFEFVNRYGEDALVLADVPNAVMLPHLLLKAEDFCTLWATEPDIFEALTAEGQRRVQLFAEAAVRAGVDGFRVVGGELVTVQLGPQAFDRLIRPHDTKLVETIHSISGIAYYHNHGRIMPWLEKLAQLGIDALDPLEAPPCGDADLTRAARILAGSVCIVGNIDDMEVLEKWPRQKVIELGRRRIREAGTKHFILGGTASGIYGESAARNFIALVEAAEEFAQR